MISRVGVLTAGGDCPGLNAGVVEAVVRLQAAGVDVVGVADGYRGLVRAGSGEPGPVQVDLTTVDLHRVARTGGSVLGASRTNLSKAELFTSAMAGVERLGLDGLVVFGGDGSLRSAARFADAGLAVAAIPKTVDDDVAMTERSIGFATAVECATEALDRLADTASTHGTSFVVELMGRRSGFLAAAVALAGRADGLAVPERRWTVAGLADRAKVRRGSLLVVAEGGWPHDVVDRPLDRKNKPQVGGVASVVVSRLGDPFRSVTFGHLVRGGVPAAADRLLASRFARLAADTVVDGRSVACVVRDGVVVAAPVDEARSGRRFLTDAALVELGGLLID